AVARFGPGDYVPPDWVHTGTVMILAWVVMVLVSLLSVLLAFIRPAVERFRPWHALLVAAIPLPFVAMIAGWVFRETGRQPWVVYGLLRTREAMSDLAPGTMTASLAVFTALFGVLVVVNYWLLARYARRGPDAAALGRPAAEPAPLPTVTY
ncbi:MAG: cytochrome ubiquinol oxidase subunit I, partial [Pseudonocardia sp.]|nr:cytochrome ubiquinol oxidase subunit I [Pseudonocardia sp.]